MGDGVNRKIDPASGTETTGHEWDGIEELNTPLPRWWLLIFYATIIWSVGYWVLYPSWPLVTGYTRGLLGYSQRERVVEEIAAAHAERSLLGRALANASLDDIRGSPDLLAFALASGKAAFGDNCTGCHGSGATGSKGYPNLQDDEWLWGGSLEAIHQTIRFGIRSDRTETRQGDMLAFGRDGILQRSEIRTVANYVLSLSGKEMDPALSLEEGKEIFARNCASCHGETATGTAELGAPDLTDAIWLHGSSAAEVMASISNGRKGVMPAWEGRLGPITLKALAVYVHSLGGGE